MGQMGGEREERGARYEMGELDRYFVEGGLADHGI
jgi:hypothetical protein